MIMSVFTPTYNRIDLMKRLFESLVSQTCQDFEWIVVDDASTDGTEEWINEIESHSSFAIVYQKVDHGGKHRAINTGVSLAKGEYLFFVDSDDYLPNNSIETIIGWIGQIGEDKTIAGIAGLRQTPKGEIVGESPRIPVGAYIECDNLKRYRKHLLGDKAEIYKTEILKKYPFPEFENEYFLTERIVWDKIAADGYILRWYNTPIYMCDYQQNGLTGSGENKKRGHIDNFQGYSAFMKQSVCVMESEEAVTFFREYDQTTRFLKMPLSKRASNIGCSTNHYLFFLLIKMPFFYIIVLMRRFVNRVGRALLD